MVIGSVNGLKKPIPAGETPATFRLGVTNWSGYLGDLGEPGVAFDLVDGAGTAYALRRIAPARPAMSPALP